MQLKMEKQTLFYEKLTSNPETQIRDLLSFCKLDWQDDCLNFHNNKRPIKTASDTQARNKIYKTSINSCKNYEKHLEKYLLSLKVKFNEKSSIMNSTLFLPRHSLSFILPAIFILFLYFLSRYGSRGVFFPFHKKLLNVVPSLPLRIEII